MTQPRRAAEPPRGPAAAFRRRDEPSRRPPVASRHRDEPSRRPDEPSRRPDESSRRPATTSGRPNESSPPAADSLRLFVALEFPAAARDALITFRDAVADPAVWRPVAPEAIHLTLAFLGRRPATDVATISTVLGAISPRAPRLALGDALLLPPRRARVLCAALDDPDGTLATLQARVSDGLEAAGVYTPEKRPFRAHATVARLRPRARAPRSIDAGPEPLEFTGEALTLFVSRLHPSGARYEPLTRIALR